MSGRLRSIQCFVWVTLASFLVMKLDVRAHAQVSSTSPLADRAVAADTRPVAPSFAPSLLGVAAEPFEGFEITDAIRDSIVHFARAQVGKRYRFGGTSPRRGFDCSGLVRYVLGQVHVRLPRIAAQQARIGKPVARERLRPGDLLSFGGEDTISHIGIYVGDGLFVHASSVAGRVIMSPLDRSGSPLILPLRGARRLYALTESRKRS